MVKIFLNQIQSAAGLTLFTTNNAGDPEYFAANTASRVVAVNSAGNAFELKSYANWDTAFSWGNHAAAGYITAATAAATYVPYTGASGNVNLGEYEIKAGQFTLDTSPTGTATVGTTRWNDTLGSSETTLKGGNVTLKNGVDLVARVVNKVTPSATLTKAAYQVVRISGAQGQRLAVNLAKADSDVNSADTLGVAIETITINQEGFIMTVGQLEGINTSGSLQGETWADGDVIYLSPTTAGAVTKVKPNGSTGHIIVVGYVEYAHATQGKLYIKVMNGWELDELHNVYINTGTLANNDILYYESSTQLWKNATIASRIATNSITTSMMSQIATSSFLGRVTAGTGNVEVLTSAQATSILDLFSTTSTTKGLVPGSNNLGTTYFLRADGTWAVPAGGGGSGTVTSVDLSMPTGFTVSNNPVTTSGTLTVTFASGYSLPTNTSQSNWDTAYSWGNHASAGYLTSIANNSITDAMLRTSAAYSVIGRSANTSGNVADITAVNDHEILRRSGTTLGFGSIDLSQSGAVGSSRLAYANLAQGVALSVLGVAGNLANDVASINAASDHHTLRRSGTTLGFGTLNAAAMNATYSAGQYLTTDVSGNLSWGTPSGGGGGGAVQLYNSTTVTGLNNSTTETAIVSYSLPTNLVAGDVIEIKLQGVWRNDTGGTRNMNLYIKLGATTVMTVTISPAAIQTTNRPFEIHTTMFVDATNSQKLTSRSFTSGAATGQLREMNTQNNLIPWNHVGFGTATEDLTSAKTLQISVQTPYAVTAGQTLLMQSQAVTIIKYPKP